MIKSIKYKNSQVSYNVNGTGYPIMLVHGFGEDGKIWKNQEKLAENYTLIIPDIPGSGQSKPLEGDDITLEDYAGCLKEILDQEKIERVIMIGHSMGGYITLAFEEMFPTYLLSFGLFHSSAFKDDEQKIETRKKGIEFIKNNGAEAFLKTSTPNLFHDPEKFKGEIMNLVSIGFKPDTLIQYYRAMIARKDRTTILSSTQKPVFLLAGAHDKAVPYDHSLKQSYIAPQTFFYTFRQSAHMAMLEEPVKTNECLRNILQYLGV